MSENNFTTCIFFFKNSFEKIKHAQLTWYFDIKLNESFLS